MSDFYEAGTLEKLAINLFYGWGYNFYRQENQLRSDDQLIRSQAGILLGWARKSVDAAETAYRREFLPAPTREQPRHDPAAVAQAQTLERLSRSIGALQGQLANLPVPENDRMTQRYRQEAETLRKLAACDQTVIGQAELLRGLLHEKDGSWIVAHLPELETGLKAVRETLQARQLLLFPSARVSG